MSYNPSKKAVSKTKKTVVPVGFLMMAPAHKRAGAKYNSLFL